MKPFDLEKALAGAKVVTRDGRDVESLFYFDNVVEGECIVAVIERGLHTFYEDGHYYVDGSTSKTDLFMAPSKKEGWIAIDVTETAASRHIGGDYVRYTSCIYSSKEKALSQLPPGSVAVKIEWEE